MGQFTYTYPFVTKPVRIETLMPATVSVGLLDTLARRTTEHYAYEASVPSGAPVLRESVSYVEDQVVGGAFEVTVETRDLYRV